MLHKKVTLKLLKIEKTEKVCGKHLQFLCNYCIFIAINCITFCIQNAACANQHNYDFNKIGGKRNEQ